MEKPGFLAPLCDTIQKICSCLHKQNKNKLLNLLISPILPQTLPQTLPRPLLKLDLRQTEKVGFDACFPLRRGRAHEAVGPSAVAFAAALCGMDGGGVLWIMESHTREQINPAGFAEYCDPANVLFAYAKSGADVLAVAEEALRSGAVSVVVAEVSKPLDLTAGRRLQLAAETGRAIGLFVILEDMGSNATETRWRCDPLFDAGDSTLQRWQIIKNKRGTLTTWVVRWDAQTRRIIVVSTAAV